MKTPALVLQLPQQTSVGLTPKISLDIPATQHPIKHDRRVVDGEIGDPLFKKFLMFIVNSTAETRNTTFSNYTEIEGFSLKI